MKLGAPTIQLVYKLLCLLFLIHAVSDSVSAQTFDLELEYDGQLREYLLHIPASYQEGEELPLLFSLHGLTNTGQINRGVTKFHEIADTANFIVCYPTALTNGFGLTAWNNGLIVGTGQDDTGFLLHLIDVIDSDYPVDRNKIYCTGFSMGGFMSNRMACEYSDVIAAIASHSGTIPVNIKDDCQTDRPFPMMHIHGNSDNIVAYGGNWAGGFVSVDSLMRHWRDHNKCSNTYTITELPNIADDDRTIDRYRFTGCENGIELFLYEVHGHNHAWLQPENDLFSSIEIWNFLKRHSLDGSIVSGIDEETPSKKYNLYPNPVSDYLKIESSDHSVENHSVEIMNSVGQTFEYEVEDKRIDVRELPAGFYLICINRGTRLPFIKM